MSSFLWSNAGFALLRDYKELDEFAPRYDPTVIPIETVEDDATSEFSLDRLNKLVDRSGQGRCSVADFHSAYKSGKVTPLNVAKALLKLASKPSEHNVAFLDIQESLVLDAAAASTQRYQDRKPLSVLDGVPVAVKDEVDLAGHQKSLGSNQDFTNPDDATSWCVHKWKEAGAIIIGKLNMHELGLGERTSESR